MTPLDDNLPLRLDRENPWPGLAPFDEADSAFFHGRQVEAAELLSLIQLEALTVLFGRSGLGKTSLLKAGVFPDLRRDNCLPVYLRLDHAEKAPSLREQVLRELHASCVAHGVDDGMPADLPVGKLAADDGSLWVRFHRRDGEFWNRDNHLVTPVLVLDQFEEIFTLGQETDAARARSAAFLQELADLVENRPPPAVKAALAQDAVAASQYQFGPATVKLVLSFREDFLAEMEDLKRAMPALMVNRLRLLPMDGAQAYAVVTEGGGALVEDEVARCILRLAWKNEPEPAVLVEDFARIEIDPALLSVVCSELNQKRRQVGMDQIGQKLLAGADREILSGFYERSLLGLDQRVRAFVEDELLTDKGYRDSHDWDDALAVPGVDQAAVTALVARRLLRVDERQGQRRLELTHDVLTRVVKESRDQRRAREKEAEAAARERAAREQQRRNRRNAVFVVLGALLVGFLLIFADRKSNLAEQMARVAQQQTVKADKLLMAAHGTRLMAAADRAQDAQYDISLLLNLEALRMKQTPDAQADLLRRFNSHPHLATFLKHESMVSSVAFSPDGKLLASTDDKTVRLWDRASGKALATLAGHEGTITGVAFSPDGKRIVSGSFDDTVRLWDVVSGKTLAIMAVDYNVNSVAFSPDGKRIVSGGFAATLSLLDVASGKALATLTRNMDWVRTVSFSPDGKWIASGGEDNAVLVWDAATGKALARLTGHKIRVNSVAFSPDSKQLASGSGDNTVRLWEVASGKALATLTGHKEAVHSVAFSPDGKQLASGSGDHTVLLWDVARRKALATLAGHKDEVKSVAFSQDGKWLASGSSDNTVLLWHVTNSKAMATLTGHKEKVNSVAFSPNGMLLASGSWDDTVLLWDAESGKALGALARQKASISSVAFSPDGKRLASGSWANTVQLWDVASRKTLVTLVVQNTLISSVAFSPDGTRLASGSGDNTVRLWDVASGKALATLIGHESSVESVSFSPDGKQLASGGLDNTVRLWDVASGKALATLSGHKETVKSVAFSPNGARLASGSQDKTVLLWDVASGKVLATLTGHKNAVNSVAFSPDGKRLASGSNDTTVILWDATPPTPANLATLEAHGGEINHVVFSPDSKQLAAASSDSTIRRWNIDPAHLTQEACRTANRNLTCAEWKQYIGPDTPYRKTCEALPAPEACQ